MIVIDKNSYLDCCCEVKSSRKQVSEYSWFFSIGNFRRNTGLCPCNTLHTLLGAIFCFLNWKFITKLRFKDMEERNTMMQVCIISKKGVSEMFRPIENSIEKCFWILCDISYLPEQKRTRCFEWLLCQRPFVLWFLRSSGFESLILSIFTQSLRSGRIWHKVNF